MRELHTILDEYKVSTDDWERLQHNPHFQRVLAGELAAWNGALNTHDRAKLKAAAMIEYWLAEANARMHDASENLTAKTEVAKLVARIADMGTTNAAIAGGGGERFSININLGADHKLRIEKDVTPKVIEGDKPQEV